MSKFLSFSNVVACLALFFALTGSVYAAAKLSGTQIKANSLPGNRVKAKTLTAKQIKPGSLTGNQIKAGSVPGTKLQAGSVTATEINQATLTGVVASKVSSIQYAAASVALGTGAVNAIANCPVGTNVVGGGATVSNDNLAFVNDTGPTGTRNGWVATGFGEVGTSMTVTAICTAAGSVSG